MCGKGGAFGTSPPTSSHRAAPQRLGAPHTKYSLALRRAVTIGCERKHMHNLMNKMLTHVNMTSHSHIITGATDSYLNVILSKHSGQQGIRKLQQLPAKSTVWSSE
jgi:hypothetical protein